MTPDNPLTGEENSPDSKFSEPAGSSERQSKKIDPGNSETSDVSSEKQPVENRKTGDAKRKSRLKKMRENRIIDALITIIFAVAAVWIVQGFLIKPFLIPSESMEPGLKPGDRVLVDRVAPHLGLKTGQVIVFYPPVDWETGCQNQGEPVAMCARKPRAGVDHSNETFIKRLVGVGGDKLAMKDGVLYRNGKKLKEPWIRPCEKGDFSCNFPKTITVPAGDYYFLGDNRGQSADSRFWGAVPRQWIVGVSRAKYWPPQRISATSRKP